MNRAYLFEPEGPKPVQGREAWADEFQTCKAWDRPPRKFHTDTPYYPWALPPKPAFSVSFKLGFRP